MEMARPSRYMKRMELATRHCIRYWRGAAFVMTDRTVGTGLNASYLVRPRRHSGRVAGPDVRRARRDLPDVARSLSHGRRARFVENGARAAEPSDFAAAADFSTQAIDTGGLSRADLAAVLISRGVAYDMMGQTERAIGDLTSRAFQRVDLVVCRAAASVLCM
jgi:hypothetical protein